MDGRFLRQMAILPPEKLQFPITVIGAGAIGSSAVVTLAKLGCSNITVWDSDLLQDHNIPNQFCKADALGMSKVEALSLLVEELSGTTINWKHRRYQGQPLSGVVIAGPDNMETRKTIWKQARYNARIPLLVDGRMGAELARLYAVVPASSDDVTFYEANLYDDAERLPCSARSIIYCPAMIGALIALLIKKYAVAEKLPKEIIFDMPSLRLTVTE